MHIEPYFRMHRSDGGMYLVPVSIGDLNHIVRIALRHYVTTYFGIGSVKAAPPYMGPPSYQLQITENSNPNHRERTPRR